MSVSTVVFVPNGGLPSVQAWVDAAALANFELVFDEPLDIRRHVGGLPVVCSGLPAAFEFCTATIKGYLAEVGAEFSWLERLRLRRYAWAADFITHSRLDDRYAAIVVAASLAHASRGLLLDCESGKFVRHSNALSWARQEVRMPEERDLVRRDRIAKAVHDFVREVLLDLGYSALAHAPDRRSSPEARWFARSGSVFRNELVEVSVESDAGDSHLCVSFIGTPFLLEKLRNEGLNGNAAGWYLYQYYPHEAFKSPEPPLPQSIPVDEGFSESTAGKRLERELRDVNTSIFQKLHDSLAADGHEWPDSA